MQVLYKLNLTIFNKKTIDRAYKNDQKREKNKLFFLSEKNYYNLFYKLYYMVYYY